MYHNVCVNMREDVVKPGWTCPICRGDKKYAIPLLLEIDATDQNVSILSNQHRKFIKLCQNFYIQNLPLIILFRTGHPPLTSTPNVSQVLDFPDDISQIGTRIIILKSLAMKFYKLALNQFLTDKDNTSDNEAHRNSPQPEGCTSSTPAGKDTEIDQFEHDLPQKRGDSDSSSSSRGHTTRTGNSGD